MNNFEVYTHKDLPSNDGGVAIGQIIIANEIIEIMQELKMMYLMMNALYKFIALVIKKIVV